MSTFEGSFLAIRPVNALSHYTDWTVGHVHAGALGWVALITFGSLYTLVPTLWKRERMYSAALVEVHFWLAIAGTLIYVFAMWNSGIIQGLMWRTYTEEGALAYSFVDSLVAMYPYYIARAFGGLLFLLGTVVGCYNIWMTVRSVPLAVGTAGGHARRPRSPCRENDAMPELFHRKLERSAIGFVIAIIAAASVGGIVEIAPLFTIDETVEKAPDMRLYTPLELAGRNIYIREGCYACHSQMIRTLRDEVERYGPYSLAVESKYDRPMLWGSKRTGPDLARIGGKYSDFWHVAHLTNPRDVVPESNMPAYRWLARTALETDDLPRASRGAARARRSLYRRDGGERGARRLRPGSSRHRLRRGRDRALRRGDPGQRVRRRDDAASPRWTRWWPICRCSGRLTGRGLREHRRSREEPDPTEGDGGGGRAMDLDHDTVVAFSKSWGLFYLIALAHRRARSTLSGHRTGSASTAPSTASSTGTTSHGSRGTRSRQRP